MQRSAIVFLILLRLAVGWHFLYEGMLKYRSTTLGPTVTSRPFSSAGYFKEAPGPLGKAWRWREGDPDEEALSRLVVKPFDEKGDPANDKPQLRMPPGLERDWDSYTQRFLGYHDLEEPQREQVRAKLQQAKSKMVDFLTYVPPTRAEDQEKDAKYTPYTTEVKRPLPPSGEFKRRMSMSERIEEYQAKVAQVREAGRKMWLMWKDTEGPRLRADKVEVARLRAGLLKDVDEQTDELKKSLDSVLTKEQKEDEGPAPELKTNILVGWIDALTLWGLIAIGACLMMGLFTRCSAWAGALFLLMTYLAVPPWPWLPVPPANEGNYLFVNKNVVELLALCVIATTATGRWFGLDGLVSRTLCWLTGKQL